MEKNLEEFLLFWTLGIAFAYGWIAEKVRFRKSQENALRKHTLEQKFRERYNRENA